MVVKVAMFGNAYRYIYENGIIEEKANPFNSNMYGDKVIFQNRHKIIIIK
jgi:hypothetical protein